MVILTSAVLQLCTNLSISLAGIHSGHASCAHQGKKDAYVRQHLSCTLHQKNLKPAQVLQTS